MKVRLAYKDWEAGTNAGILEHGRADAASDKGDRHKDLFRLNQLVAGN
jgi:hypothetical protein